MRITILPTDKYISIDNQGLLNIQEDLSWIPINVHAVQWYDTWGEIEYNDGNPNERIEELGVFEQAIQSHNNEVQRIENEKIAAEAARDYWEELRFLRNEKLNQCDWTQVADVQLSDAQKVEWTLYRQQLRDLPNNINDPKPLVLDKNHSDWPIKPQ
jgi:hypothetical protein